MERGFVDHVRELMAPLGPVQARRMFGGWGLYRDGLFFGLIEDDRLYLKVDEQTEAEFRAADCAPFVYEGGGRRMVMSYWSVPEAALDAADEMRPWMQRALEAASRRPAIVKRKSTKRKRKDGA